MTEPSIHTGGGAAVAGHVSAGTFIGRDQIIVLATIPPRIWVGSWPSCAQRWAGGKPTCAPTSPRSG